MITGPFTKTVGSPTSKFYRKSVGYRQTAGRKPLPYDVHQVHLIDIGFNQIAGGYTPAPPQRLMDIAYSKAYAQFSEKVTETAALGNAVATIGQSVSMIEQRATQLFRFARALRKGKVFQALRELKMPPEMARKASQKYHRSKSASGQFLEYRFGWAPAMADLQTAMRVLADPLPGGLCVGRGSSQNTEDYPYLWPILPGTCGSFSQNSYRVYCRVQARVRVINPNTSLANRLGLTNPIDWLYEVTPWSFLLDWVSNASQFLSAWDDFMGLELTDDFHTYYTRVEYRMREVCAFPAVASRQMDGFGYRVTRTLGIPQPNFVFIIPPRVSVVRAATAVALLFQQLPKR